MAESGDRPFRIFMSSGGGDAALVDGLARDLRANGFALDLYHYRDDMPPGAEVKEELRGRVWTSDVAILCLSDDAVGRGWVATEIAWTDDAVADENKPMRQVLLVKVGPLDHPALIKRCPVLEGRDIPDLTDAARGQLNRMKLLERLVELRWGAAPTPILATVVAMTADECRTIIDGGGGSRETAKELCTLVGLAWPGEDPLAVGARYGADALDFRPFGSSRPITEIAIDALGAYNVHARQADGSPPLLLRWVTPAEVDGIGASIAQPNSGGEEPELLIVVDSLSLLLDQHKAALDQLLGSTTPDRRAIAWVPPFTHGTCRLEASAANLIHQHGAIKKWFDDWRKPKRFVDAFDFATEAGLRRHLVDMLARAARHLQAPDVDRREQMKQQFQPPPVNPRQQSQRGGVYRP